MHGSAIASVDLEGGGREGVTERCQNWRKGGREKERGGEEERMTEALFTFQKNL